MKLSIIIPVYNEKSTIHEILKKVKEVRINKEIIVVDDGSTDGTREILEQERGGDLVVVYNSLINIGKGAAVRIGFEQVSGDVVIIQDADLELDPQDCHELIRPVLEGKADVVYGSRFLKKVRGLSLRTRIANRILTFLTNALYHTSLTDMETCYKVIKTGIIKEIKFKSIGFEIEPEITAKLTRLGYKIHEVPISYHPRTVEQGKKIRWTDGLKAIYFLIKYRFAKIEEIAKIPR